MNRCVVFASILFFSIFSKSFETDSFTKRHLPLRPADFFANQKMQELLTNGMNEANRQSVCQDEVLVQSVRNAMGNWIVGRMESYLESSEEVPKHQFSYFKNVYSGKPITQSIRYPVGLRSAIRINGQYVGIDKLDHFLDQGFDYFILFRKAQNLESIFSYGRKMESTYFGLQLTGVYSYADLTANYEGFLFWSQVVGGLHPYFKCESGKWRQVRNFTWSDYVNAAWDEGINCSHYINESIRDAVTKSQTIKCPVQIEACQLAAVHYGSLAREIINPECLK